MSDDATPQTVGGIAGAELKAYIERIESLAEEIRSLNDDVKAVYAEAKGNGYDVKIIREVVQLRKMDRSELFEQETLLDLYMKAIGMKGGAA